MGDRGAWAADQRQEPGVVRAEEPHGELLLVVEAAAEAKKNPRFNTVFFGIFLFWIHLVSQLLRYTWRS